MAIRRADDFFGLRGETKRRQQLRSLKDLDQAALVLQQTVRLLRDESVPEARIWAQVMSRIGEDPLREAVGGAGRPWATPARNCCGWGLGRGSVAQPLRWD